MAGMPELPVEVRAGRLGWSGDPRPTRLATDRRHGGAKFAAAVPAWHGGRASGVRAPA